MPVKAQEKKAKQFAARSSRSASYGRNLNKLGRITSIEEIHQRPTLNRSKSTDGTLGRKNRSFTKLSTLQPLARTRSHQPVHRSTGKAILELSKDSDDENAGDKNEESEEEVEEFSDEGDNVIDEQANNLQSTQIHLSYKSPAQFSHNSIPRESPLSSMPPEQSKQATVSQEEQAPKNTHRTLEEQTSSLNLNGSTSNTGGVNSKNKKQETSNYKDRISPYYQNMILSQSTGVVRDFSDQPFINSLNQLNNGGSNNANGNHHDTLQYIHSNDHISGTLGNLKSASSSTNSLRQFTLQTSAGQSMSNESSMLTAFKGREPSGVSFASSSRIQRESAAGTPRNFNQFLKSNNSNIETRTQQRLWLQRENSLLDLPSASGNNNNNPQLRRDFEKVSREYVNVRRFFNPSLESTKRVNKRGSPAKTQTNARQNQQPGYIIRTVNTNDFQAKLYKLWVNGDPSTDNRPIQSSMEVQYHQQQQQQQQHIQHKPTLIQSANMSMTGMGTSLRSPAAPSTRAVDRANNSPENKGIDLAAIRVPEEHVQKLS